MKKKKKKKKKKKLQPQVCKDVGVHKYKEGNKNDYHMKARADAKATRIRRKTGRMIEAASQ